MRYRQDILADCLVRSDIVRQMYALAVEATREGGGECGVSRPWYPAGVLYQSIEVLPQFLDLLKRLKHITDAHGGKFRSEGFTKFFGMFARELDEEYLRGFEDHLRRLDISCGVLRAPNSTKVTKAPGTSFTPQNMSQDWAERLSSWINEQFSRTAPVTSTRLMIAMTAAFAALAEIRNRGIGLVAQALAQSTDHLLDFLACCDWSWAFTSVA